MSKTRKKSEHYVDNKVLQAMIEYKDRCEKQKKKKKLINYIGECFLKIAESILL